MADDIAFKIQLGIILPKLKDTVGDNLSAIIKELAGILQAGTLEGDEPISIDAVKEIIMKDLEIFLDDSIFPEIDKILNPPEPEPEPTAEAEAESEELEAEPA